MMRGKVDLFHRTNNELVTQYPELRSPAREPTPDRIGPPNGPIFI